MQKLYVLIRNDLSLAYGAVQGGHAVAQFLLDNPISSWKNHTLVYVSVAKEKFKWFLWEADMLGLSSSKFYEPDIGNELTAVAVLAEEDTLFKCLSLF